MTNNPPSLEPHVEPCVPCLLAQLAQAPAGGFEITTRRVPAGSALFRQDEPLRHPYAVRSGTLKLVASDMRCREQVLAFRRSGELLGLDGLADGAHHASAIALEEAQVASLPVAGLHQALAAQPRLIPAFLGLLGRELVRDKKRILLLGTMSAEERLAAFLLNTSIDTGARGGSATDFELTMTRGDIASYLALQVETVSRILHRFQARGLLALQRRRVRLLDPGALRAFFGSPVSAPAP